MKKKIDRNEAIMCAVSALIFMAMFILPVCAWELWTTLDERAANRAATCRSGDHVCEYCGAEVHD